MVIANSSLLQEARKLAIRHELAVMRLRGTLVAVPASARTDAATGRTG